MRQRLLSSQATLSGLKRLEKIAGRTSNLHNIIGSQQRRWKTAAPFIDFANNEIVKNTVKNSILDMASKKDSRLWTQGEAATEYPPHAFHGDYFGGVNDPITMEPDSLDDWSLDRATKYWPNLPPNVQSTASADPFALAQTELDDLSRSIREDLLGTDHPVLSKAASYFSKVQVARKSDQ